MIKPDKLPQQPVAKTISLALEMSEKTGIPLDLDKPFILGQRGYFLNSIGVVGKNDRGKYDDAIFIVSPYVYKSFWANTDPSGYRKGHGYGNSKGMASLDPGIWTFKRGLHRGSYMALVQRVEEVVVTRDGSPDYKDEGWHGINIHKGGTKTTSSLGCQTIYPSQWSDFYNTVDKLMDKYEMNTIEYVLVEKQG